MLLWKSNIKFVNFRLSSFSPFHLQSIISTLILTISSLIRYFSIFNSYFQNLKYFILFLYMSKLIKILYYIKYKNITPKIPSSTPPLSAIACIKRIHIVTTTFGCFIGGPKQTYHTFLKLLFSILFAHLMPSSLCIIGPFTKKKNRKLKKELWLHHKNIGLFGWLVWQTLQRRFGSCKFLLFLGILLSVPEYPVLQVLQTLNICLKNKKS